MAISIDRLDTPAEYFAELGLVQARLPWPTLEGFVDRLIQLWEDGATLYTLGNGGSAALAAHWACDFGKGTADSLPAGRRLRVVSLTDNVALTTAWANDVGYDQIFAQQLTGIVNPNDAVLAISGSGNSPNVLAALGVARRAGASVLGLTGFQGGRMRDQCDLVVVVPSESMQIVEDIHVSLCHAMFLRLRARLRHSQAIGVRAAVAAGR